MASLSDIDNSKILRFYDQINKIKMASRRQNLKRKSKDFIYEINENDLSADEDSEDIPAKMQKIEGNCKESSGTASPNLLTEAFIEKNDKARNSMKSIEPTNTNNIDASAKSEKMSLPSGKDDIVRNIAEESILDITPENPNQDVSIIEIMDSDIELNCSIQIIEKEIPLVEVSDEETLKSFDVTQEDGEILDVFEVVDEVGPTPIKKENDNYIINISFKTEEIKKSYESKILMFLNSFSEFDICSEELSINVCKKLDIPKVSENIAVHKTPKKKHKKKKAKRELFVLDTNPSLNDSTADVRYSSKFTIEGEKPEELSSPQKSIFAQSCFNCGQSHSLRDCTVPKDFNKINAARQKFASNKNKVMRYHVDEEQKFAHLKPGVISENLRRALGLRKNELPSYIYGMRVLGYPPGWLEEAKIVNSSLRMFNIDGGKVKINNQVKKKGLDPDKIIEYPGFNAPMEKGFYDDFRKYNVKPYSKNTEKQFMLKHFDDLCDEANDSETSDMDLDENTETNTKVVDKKLMEKQSSWCDSPTLTDLEKQKKNLINQLNASNSKNQLIETVNEISSPNNESESAEEEYQKQPIIAVKGSTLGTPIIKTGSPYSHLPNPDNFTVGVSPVIDFENLPNSTGKYEQMSGVLSKVRSTMKNLESCKS